MLTKEYIQNIAETALAGTDKFITDIKVKTGNIITVTIDSDSTLTIDDCISVSKSIESKLDRDAEDFELRVTSYGADSPIKFRRQYKKNIGRMLELTLSDQVTKTVLLTGVSDEAIEIEYKQGKKKTDAVLKQAIPFDDIEKSRVVLSFK
jgi:ribosome maturation factor RimP